MHHALYTTCDTHHEGIFVHRYANHQFNLKSDCGLLTESKNTGAWKGRHKRFFVDPYTVELAKNGSNII